MYHLSSAWGSVNFLIILDQFGSQGALGRTWEGLAGVCGAVLKCLGEVLAGSWGVSGGSWGIWGEDWRVEGRVFGGLGRILEVFGRVLMAFGGAWEGLGRVLGGLGRVLGGLGRVLGGLGRVLGGEPGPGWPESLERPVFWMVFGSQNGAQNGLKIDQKFNQIFDAFYIGILSDFDRFGMPKWGQLDTKVESKIDVNFERHFFTERILAAAGARSAGLRRSKLGGKMN